MTEATIIRHTAEDIPVLNEGQAQTIDTVGYGNVLMVFRRFFSSEYIYRNEEEGEIIFHHDVRKKSHSVTAQDLDGNMLVKPVHSGRSERFRVGKTIFEISHT